MSQTKLTETDPTGEGQTKAHEMAKKQREISVAEFFAKNRHLLGFDNPKKSLLTTIKEAVDNSLDACEEAGLLPEIAVEVIQMGDSRFKVVIEDNGPGIVKKQIPNIFAKLLYGSKFHSLKQQRGQQGIGISASVMYGQMTTGKAARITSRIGANYEAHYFELKIDTQTNKPLIQKDDIIEWHKERGTRIELDLEASYSKGAQSIDAYLKQTAIANPHVTIIYTNPKAEQIIFPRAVDKMPLEAKEIKPHPYGIELGLLIKMISWTASKTLQHFLMNEFSRVSSSVAKEICEHAKLLPNTKPKQLKREHAEKILNAIKQTKIMNPPTDCISPIGSDALEKGLKKEIKAEFYCATTRPPSVYRGNPFVIEAALAYGGEMPKDKSIRILRYANRVPIQYQQSACASTHAIMHTNFKNYGLHQSRNSIPVGPMTLVIHMASVWVPFTSESKEAIAHYPEIIKEVKLAIQECGRLLASYVNKKNRLQKEMQKRSYIEKYIPHVGTALKKLLDLTKEDEAEIEEILKKILEQKRGKLKKIEAENLEYDEEFAKIGSATVEDELESDDENNGGENDE
ncbi:DNA topoisomerase VI subunit B [Candidatus Woesearchaeota archaeon]|jgi:DNA topoisomerase VI subunit B|nr:DNA topoisomerase VI subunit B [Candidatus Woesearchaeota archaeon]